MPFIDIFSKRKNKQEEKERPLIIADQREKNSLVISELASLGAQVNIEHLEVADFLANGVAVERKTVSDFLSSMINKRMSQQLINLQQYENRLLIIEGIQEKDLYTDSSRESGINPSAVRGFLLDIVLKYKVPIIFTKNYEDTAKFLLVLAKKSEKTLESLRAKRKPSSLDEQKQFILEGFPGIGPGTAKKLLKEYGSIKNIINSSSEELQHSIGKKAESFRKLLD